MRSRGRLGYRASSFVVSAAILLTTARFARAADAVAAPPSNGAPPSAASGNGDRKLSIPVRVGLAFPGSMTPTEISPTSLGFGFAAQVESNVVVHRLVELGGYVHYAYRPIDSVGSTHDGTSSNLLSVGGAVKLRLVLSDVMRMRLGMYVGLNVETESYSISSSSGTIVGEGLNFGPSVEWSYDLGPGCAFTAQFSFISQLAGHATLPEEFATLVRNGQSQTLTFPPLVFLVAGVEFYAL